MALQAALPAAVYADDPAILQWMLEQGADPRGVGLIALISGRDTGGSATANVRSEMLRIVLRAGVDPNEIVNTRAKTALVAAIGADDFDALRLLLEAGANPNVRNEAESGSQWPLEAAVIADRVPMVRLLLEAGADPSKLEGSSGDHKSSIQAMATRRLAGATTPEIAQARSEIVRLLTRVGKPSPVRRSPARRCLLISSSIKGKTSDHRIRDCTDSLGGRCDHCCCCDRVRGHDGHARCRGQGWSALAGGCGSILVWNGNRSVVCKKGSRALVAGLVPPRPCRSDGRCEAVDAPPDSLHCDHCFARPLSLASFVPRRARE